MKKTLIAIMLILAMLFSTTAAFAAEDPAINIVCPAQEVSVTSGSLLISVKISKVATVKVSVLQGVTGEDGTVSYSKSIFASDPYATTTDLSFYTKKLENVTAGVYKVRVETLNADGTVAYTTDRKVTVKNKPIEDEGKLFSAAQSGTVTFLQNLLKSIFGN